MSRVDFSCFCGRTCAVTATANKKETPLLLLRLLMMDTHACLPLLFHSNATTPLLLFLLHRNNSMCCCSCTLVVNFFFTAAVDTRCQKFICCSPNRRGFCRTPHFFSQHLNAAAVTLTSTRCCSSCGVCVYHIPDPVAAVAAIPKLLLPSFSTRFSFLLHPDTAATCHCCCWCGGPAVAAAAQEAHTTSCLPSPAALLFFLFAVLV